MRQRPAYRLTRRLVPPPGSADGAAAPLPLESTLNLGTGPYVVGGYGVIPAVAAENRWRLRGRSTGAADTGTRCAEAIKTRARA